VSGSTYVGTASTVTVGQTLPGGGTAIANGAYPYVFNNNTVDGSFGVTSPIFIQQLTTSGTLVSTYNVPTSQLTTSFSSKSELSLNLSTNGNAVTFMGYVSPTNALDVSNSNTPGIVDPTNPVTSANYRAVAQLDASGNLTTTTTNAYSGNNPRAAIEANGVYYTAGNAGNGSGTPPAAIVAGTGVQIITPGQNATPSTPGTTMVGSFSISQVINPETGQPYPPDKPGKDNNYRGETIFDNTLYVTKGSGSNGINTVYQVGNAGSLPTAANAASAPITILPGFPSFLANSTAFPSQFPYGFYPFGIWFANATTLYVANEGDGTLAHAGIDPNSGLQKWSLVNGTWHLDYTLQNGLGLGQPYSVANDPTGMNPAYPTGTNSVTGLNWAPETDGLRNLTGKFNPDGTVSLYAITSTVSGSGDQGADPNRLVAITDNLSYTTAAQAANEQFTTLEAAVSGQVLRGVSFAPAAVPEPASLVMAGTAALAGLGYAWRRRKAKDYIA
jgi:PEP-CTERM motif